MTKSIEELVLILDNRINKLKKQLKDKFVNESNDPFLINYKNLKKEVGEWISSLSPQKHQKQNKHPSKPSKI